MYLEDLKRKTLCKRYDLRPSLAQAKQINAWVDWSLRPVFQSPRVILMPPPTSLPTPAGHNYLHSAAP